MRITAMQNNCKTSLAGAGVEMNVENLPTWFL